MTDTYRTFAGNTIANLEAFHDNAQGANAKTLEVTLRTASRVLLNLAPMPQPDEEGQIPADFLQRAQDGELMLSRYIFDTDGGQTSSASSIVGSSISYQSNPKVMELIAASMGSYAKSDEEEEGSGGDDGTAYVSRAWF